jgi:outer membrane immunogenic protein
MRPNRGEGGAFAESDWLRDMRSDLQNGRNNNNGGWLVGAGFEYAFTNNWTVKLEYDYLGLGNRTFVIPAAAPFLAGDTFTANNRNVQMVKVGVNYLFNWGAPVTARY